MKILISPGSINDVQQQLPL